MDCISLTVSKILGYAIILGSCAVKFPQIINILKAGNAEGLLPSMYYVESLMYIISGTYNVHLGSPFSVYGDNFFLVSQNVIIMLLIWKYQHDTPFLTKFLVTSILGGSLGFLLHDKYMTPDMWKLAMNSQFLLLTYSRIPQILQNFNSKSTGQLALATFMLNFAGNLARLFTFFKEVPDVLNILTASLSAAFNLTLVIQILIYWGNSGKSQKTAPSKKPDSKKGKKKIE